MPSYPINAEVLAALQGLGGLATALGDLSGSTRSRLHIVRMLGNTHYENVARCLSLIESGLKTAEPICRRLLQQTDAFQFEQVLAELFLFAYLNRCLPERAQSVDGGASETRPDIEIVLDVGCMRVEVYSPTDFMGYQLWREGLIAALKYVEVDRGFDLKAIVEVVADSAEPDLQTELDHPYLVSDERHVRQWLAQFEREAALWLTRADHGATLEVDGPDKGLRVRVEASKLFDDRDLRTIAFSSPTRSTDTRLFFESGTAADTARSQWGVKLKAKLNKRQCGEPVDHVLRVLVVDFSRAETGWPNFICWPEIARRLDEVVRLLAPDKPPPYELVLPARLGFDCCFGVPVWLVRPLSLDPERILDEVGLTRRCGSEM
jgi:hypothetical protein